MDDAELEVAILHQRNRLRVAMRRVSMALLLRSSDGALEQHVQHLEDVAASYLLVVRWRLQRGRDELPER